MTQETDARLVCASNHATAVMEAAKALDAAIYKAACDGYHAKVRVTGPQTPDGSFVGTGYGTGKIVLAVKATIVFDIGGAV